MAPATELPGLGARPIVSLRREHGTWIPRDESPAGLQIGLLDTTAGAGGGHLGLAEHALTLSLEGGPGGLAATAFSTEGTDGVSPASGALVSWSAGDTPFALRAGWLAEREEMLGTSGRGAFAGLSADAVFAGIDARTHLGGWKLFGGAELGTVSAGRDDGLIAGLSPLTTSAFAFHAMRTLGDDQGLRLSISQPLRVESGQAALSVPRGPHEGRRRPPPAGDRRSLSPHGRQIDVAARWHRRWTGGGELRLGAVWTREPPPPLRRGPEPRPPRRLATNLLTPARAGGSRRARHRGHRSGLRQVRGDGRRRCPAAPRHRGCRSRATLIQGNDEQAENELRGLPPRHAKGREAATRAVEIDKPARLTAPPDT